MAFAGFFAYVAAAVQFVFSGTGIVASALRFIGGSILSQLLAGTTKTEGPRLSDLKVQVSTYGNAIPRVYGEAVRTAGNVIDKSDLHERKKKKRKKMLGIVMASNTTYFYSVDLVILICEGQLPDNALRRVFAAGKVVFDRDAPAAVAPTDPDGGIFSEGAGVLFGDANKNKTHALFSRLTFYPGSATQDIDPLVQALHPGEAVPAYRHSAYVVIEGLQLADYGNGIPNIEFEYETNFTTVRSAIEDLASFADVTLNGGPMSDPLRGYVVAKAGSVWDAIEPLAGVFSFDLITDGGDFRAIRRGTGMRTILTTEDFAGRDAKEQAKDLWDLSRKDANTFPDEVNVTYFDIDRDYQPNTQRAFRNESFAKNKVDVEVAVVLNADEGRSVAGRTLAESIASAGAVKLYLVSKYRWLRGADVIGVPIDGEIYSFRIGNVIESPNQVVVVEGVFEDGLCYVQNVAGASGIIPDNSLALPGDTLFQPMDTSIVEDVDDDTGFYFAVSATGLAWSGGDIYRAEGVGSPLTYELITDPVVAATIGDCVSTLASGPTDVWDWVNTLDVQLLNTNDTLDSVTEDDVVTRNANFAWVGQADGFEGEYINFLTATPSGSPSIYTLSGLLRGRRGTEFAVGLHVADERLVMFNSTEVGRMDFGPIDWGLSRTYKTVSLPLEVTDDGDVLVFANSGEGKRPYAGAHLNGVRNGANNDILIEWERRTRFETPALGGGPVPLGEEVEAYEVDIRSGVTVLRTLTSTTTSVNYTTAMQTTDGHTLGAAVTVDVYQMSGVRGRGHPLTGTV